MKNILFTIIAFMIFGFSYCQHTLSQDEYNRLSDQEKDLYDRLYADEVASQNRINAYLAANPDAKRVIYRDEKVFILDDVINDTPLYMTTDNADSAATTRTNTLQVGGSLGLDLDGSGITVGVWDGGPVQSDHPEFTDENGSNSRINNIELSTTEGGSNDDSHATHVTGTIAARGADPEAKGMATKVNVNTYNFNNDLLEMTSAISSNTILMSNHSYGLPVTENSSWRPGAYVNSSRNIDDLLRTYPKYLSVHSAGNSGTVNYQGGLYPNSDKLSGDKTAKNNLVVANANGSLNPITSQLNSFSIHESSSQGPTDDLRIKPDITADGSFVKSSVPGSSYETQIGTSMAAPNVTGTLVLLQQYWNQIHGEYMNSSTLKGLVCHTALDDDTNIGPDHVYGWGLLDAKFAAETITKSQNGTALIEELTLLNNGTYTLNFSAEAGDVLRATICWTDMPGNPVSSSDDDNLNNQTPRLKNDLDLRITKDNTTYFPWRLEYDPNSGFSNSKSDNIRDNVERIDVEVPETGNYTLSVTHKGNLSSDDLIGLPSQDFALILTGNNISLNATRNQLNSISLYPNPTSDVMYVEGVRSDLSYVLYSIQGKMIKNGQLTAQTNHINLQGVNRGVYLLKLFDNTSTLTKKIIKQ